MYRFVDPPSARPVAPAAWPDEPLVRSTRLTPARVMRLVRRRKGIVLACGVVAAALGLAYGKLAPARYVAFAQLIIDPTDLRVTDRSLRTANQFGDALVAQVENQVRVITSSSVLDRVIADQRLEQDEEFNGTRPPNVLARAAEAVRGFLGEADPGAAPTPLLAAQRILERDVSAKRDERTYVVNVGATARSPEKSVRLADAVVDAYLAETAEARDAVSRRIADALGQRLAELRSAVERAEQRVEEYRRRNNLVSAVGSSVVEQQLADASTRLQAAQTAQAQAQSRYAQVQQAQRSGDAGAVPEALRSNTMMNLRNQATEVERRLGDVTATRGARHPEVIEIRAQDAAARRAVAAELARIAGAAKTDYERARADVTEMRRSYDALKSAVGRKDEASVRLRELERDVQASRSVYETFLTRTREVSEQEKVDAANIRVISRAQLPERRASPPRTLLLVAAGLLAGLILGAGIAVLRGLTKDDGEGDGGSGDASARPGTGATVAQA